MANVAIIEKTMSSTNYDKYFDFEHDRLRYVQIVQNRKF